VECAYVGETKGLPERLENGTGMSPAPRGTRKGGNNWSYGRITCMCGNDWT
jgi:hypothetical protein